MKLRKQSSTSYPITFLMVDSADHLAGKTGLSPTVTISKNGGAFGAPAGAVSEIGSGWYALAGNATDRGTLGDLLVHATATGADPVDDRYLIVPWDPFDAADLGLLVLSQLDVTAVSQVAANSSGHLTIIRTTSYGTTLSGLDIPADWEACYWTVKRSTDDPDAEALIQMLESNPGDAEDGVQVLMGVALTDESDGSLTVNQALGTVTIALGDASTALLEDAVELVWDVKVHTATGKTQPGAGTATITTAVTRA